jgi:hypothetical protein
MRKAMGLLLTALALIQTAIGQTGKISGKVLGEADQPMENATVALTKASDTVVLKFAVAAKTGEFVFNKLATGSYKVHITAMGYAKKQSDNIEITEGKPEADLGTMKLLLGDKSQMKEVTVTAKRPMFEVKPDKTSCEC